MSNFRVDEQMARNAARAFRYRHGTSGLVGYYVEANGSFERCPPEFESLIPREAFKRYLETEGRPDPFSM